MTDLMAGVAVTFLLLAAIFMIQAGRANAAAQKVAAKAQLVVKKTKTEDSEVRARLMALRDKIGPIAQIDASDPFLLVVTFETVKWFETGQCELQPAIVKSIQDSVVTEIRKVCSHEYLGDINSVVLEGHTDPLPFLDKNRRCGGVEECPSHNPAACVDIGFRNNVRLSAARAQEVFFEARKTLEKDDRPLIDTCFDKFFVVAGRGPADSLSGVDWRDVGAVGSLSRTTLAQDRRVVLKVRFRSPRVSGTDEPAP